MAPDDGTGSGEKSKESESADTRTPQYDPERVAKAIRLNDGNLTDAADSVGCHYATVYRYCDEFDVCAEAKREARNKGIDKARQTLTDLMDAAPPETRRKAAESYIDFYDAQTEPDKKQVTGDGGGPIMVIESSDDE